MKRAILVIGILFSIIHAYGQSVLWEKDWGMIGRESFHDIYKVKDSALYIAHGETGKFRFVNRPNPNDVGITYYSPVIYKIDSTGDTLISKYLAAGVYWFAKSAGQLPNGNHLFYLHKFGQYSPSAKFRPSFMILNPLLDSVWSITYTNRWAEDWLQNFTKVQVLPDGGWVAVGSRGSGCGINAYAIRFDSLGVVKYDRTFNYFGTGEDVDEISLCDDGDWLISGHICSSNKGFAMKVDLMRQSPVVKWKRDFVIKQGVQYSRVLVSQNADHTFSIGGFEKPIGANSYIFAARYDSSMTNQLWYMADPTTTGGYVKPLEDGGFLIMEGKNGQYSFHSVLKRYDIANNLLWSLPLGDVAGVTFRVAESYAFTDNDEIIVAGYLRRVGFGGNYNAEDFYIAKISGTGNPYVPGTINPVLSAKPSMVSVPALHFWPNPTADLVNIDLPNGVAVNYKLLNTSGQLVQGGVSAGSISMRTLAAGVYLLQLWSDGRVYPVVRVVRR